MTGIFQLERCIRQIDEAHDHASSECERHWPKANADFPTEFPSFTIFENASNRFCATICVGDYPASLFDDAVALKMWPHREVWVRLAPHYEDCPTAYRMVMRDLAGGRTAFARAMFDACLAEKTSMAINGAIIAFNGAWKSFSLEQCSALTNLFYDRFGHFFDDRDLERRRLMGFVNMKEYLREYFELVGRNRALGRTLKT